MLSYSITLDTTPLMAALARLPAALDASKPPMRGAMEEASTQLMLYERRRFRSASGGDGTWAPLAFSTKRSRLYAERKAAGSKTRLTKAIIAAAVMPVELITGSLESGLFEKGGPGHFQSFTPDSVSEGVEGGTHPSFKGGVGKLAVIQHYGSGNIPARPLMAAPQGADLSLVMQPIVDHFPEAVALAIGGYGTAPAGGFGTP